MKCHIMWHFIWVFTVCKSAPLGVSCVQRVKEANTLFISEITMLKTLVMDFESTLTLL